MALVFENPDSQLKPLTVPLACEDSLGRSDLLAVSAIIGQLSFEVTRATAPQMLGFA